MNQLANLISEGLVNALGWTLLHALWQGSFVALLLSVLLVLLHRQSAEKRYVVASSAMVMQLLLSIATFAYYCTRQSVGAAVSHVTAAGTSNNALTAAFWAEPVAVSQVYFEQHLPLLVALWLLGMALMAIRFIGGVAYTQRLRYYKTKALAEQWQEQLSVLRRRLGVRQAVQLVESALVQVPMAIGVAKPMILLPVGAVTGLTQAQVEAILAHELAHILRKDYLLNLLQSVIEILFFFHPAMWWVAGVVRAERENCCDDIAVALCGDTLTYARALTELEAMCTPHVQGVALAFSGQRGSLMSRIKRLVGQPLRPTFTEGFAAGLVLVVGMLILSFGAMAEHQPLNDPKSDQKEGRVASTKEEGEEAVTYVAQDADGNSRNVVIITNKKGKVKQLYVDGKRIPKRNIDKYKDLVDQRLQMTQNAPKASREEVEMLMQKERKAIARAQQDNRERSVTVERFSGEGVPPLPPLPPLPPMPAIAPVPPPFPAPPAPPVKATKKEQKAYERELARYEEEVQRYERQMEQTMSEFKQEVMARRIAQDSLRQKEAMRHSDRAAEMRARMEARQHEMEERRAAMEARKQEMDARRQEMEERRIEHAKNMEEMKAEMVKDGLIDSKGSNLNIQVNNGELLINGKKQPQHVYDKYKKWISPDKTR